MPSLADPVTTQLSKQMSDSKNDSTTPDQTTNVLTLIPQAPKPKTVDAVIEVFEHWRIILGYGRARLDEKRANVIRARLRNGYTVADLCLAIEGCAASAFHQGDNDRHTRYDSLSVICRDADHVDQFMAIGERARAMIEAQQSRKQEAAQKAWTPPTPEERERVRQLLAGIRIRGGRAA